MRKSLFIAGLLTVSSLIVAGTKSYKFTIAGPAKVGTVQLAKGDYTLQLDGDKAVFTDQHDKSVTVPVKVDTGAAKKFEYTSVEATEKNGQSAIKVIHLGGSTTSVEFAD